VRSKSLLLSVLPFLAPDLGPPPGRLVSDSSKGDAVGRFGCGGGFILLFRGGGGWGAGPGLFWSGSRGSSSRARAPARPFCVAGARLVVKTDIAVGSGARTSRTEQDAAVLVRIGRDPDITIAFQRHHADAAIFGTGRAALALDLRLARRRRLLHHLDIAIAGDDEIDVAAIGHQPHVTVAAGLDRTRRLRAGLAAAAAAFLAAGLLAPRQAAEVHVILGGVQFKIKEVAALAGGRRVAHAGLQIGIAAAAELAGAFVDVLVAEAQVA